MASFLTVLKSVSLMLVYILMGYFLVKSKKADSSHAKGLSAFLVYVCCPCLMISSFLNMDYSLINFKKAMTFFAASLLIQFLFFIVLFIIFGRKYDDAKYRVLSVCGTLGNVGFFGLPIVTSLFPNEPIVACYSTVNVASMNLLCFTVGVFLITNDKKFISLKSAILNPTTSSFLIALPLYLLQVHFPTFVVDSITLMGRITTPLSMVIIGFRLASIPLKTVFTQKFAYQACLIKLILFPIFAFVLIALMPFADDVFKTCIYVLGGAPAGAVILSLSELHECEQKNTANAVLLTTLLSLITVPVLMLFV